jgi:hypothetical protein
MRINSTDEEYGKGIQKLMRIHVGKRSVEKPSRRRDDNIKIYRR